MGLWWSLRLQNTPLATQQAFPKELHQSTPVKNTRPVAIAAPGQAQQSRVDGVRQSRSAEPARCLVPNMGTAQPGTSGSVKVSPPPPPLPRLLNNTGEPCSVYPSCFQCVQDPFCGWCASAMQCVEGTREGPIFGACEEWEPFAMSASCSSTRMLGEPEL